MPNGHYNKNLVGKCDAIYIIAIDLFCPFKIDPTFKLKINFPNL